MKTAELFKNLIRYGKIKSDLELKDSINRLFRIRVFEYENKKYFTVMVDGDLLECKEV